MSQPALWRWTPYGFVLLAVLLVGVNTPYYDEWNTWVFDLAKFENFPTWKLVWSRFDEHYIALTKLTLAIFTHFEWGSKALMTLSTLVWIGTGRKFWSIARASFPQILDQKWDALLLAALLFSFAEREVFFFGFNLHFSLVTFASVWMAQALLNQTGWRSGIEILGALTLGVCSFTAWIAMIPVLALPAIDAKLNSKPDRRNWLAFEAVTLAISIGVIYRLYFFTANAASRAIGSGASLVQDILFFLRLLGSPFVMTGGAYQHWALHGFAIGLGLLFLYWSASIMRARKRPLEWALIAIAVTATAIYTHGRAGTLDYAGAASRFTTLTIPAWCFLLGLALREPHRRKIAQLLLLLSLVNSAVNLSAEIMIRRPKLEAARRVWLQRLDYPEAPVTPEQRAAVLKTHFNPDMIEEMLRTLPQRKPELDFLFR